MPGAVLRLPADQARPVKRLLSSGLRGFRATETPVPTAHPTVIDRAIDTAIDEACSLLGLSLTRTQRTWVHAALSGHPVSAPRHAKVGWVTAHRVTLEVLANPNAPRSVDRALTRHPRPRRRAAQ